MTLRQDEYKIIDDGIWIPKSVLEEKEKHYTDVINQQKPRTAGQFYYAGKRDVVDDLLKYLKNDLI